MRKPDVTINHNGKPYLLRWWIIPRNRFFNIYLHKILQSDDARALHDHPWLFNISILLKGDYREYTYRLAGLTFLKSTSRFAGTRSGFKFRWGKAPHRIKLIENCDNKTCCAGVTGTEKPVWTLFITGPRIREWGFYCPNGWRHNKDYLSLTENGNTIGKGCD